MKTSFSTQNQNYLQGLGWALFYAVGFMVIAVLPGPALRDLMDRFVIADMYIIRVRVVMSALSILILFFAWIRARQRYAKRVTRFDISDAGFDIVRANDEHRLFPWEALENFALRRRIGEEFLLMTEKVTSLELAIRVSSKKPHVTDPNEFLSSIRQFVEIDENP